ncbi:MAG: dTMP kinase [Clostridiales bacterium]|nr:dTMP kinase [Clostridiales bacterium]
MDISNHKPGVFVVFEGLDGSGKSTQVRHLMKRLNSISLRCYETKEPTDGPIGSLIHQVMTGRVSASDKVIAALFVADRLDHLLNTSDGIADKINHGISVISDRYYLSSYAYHSTSLPMKWVIEANSISAGILRPNCHIFIDIDPETALSRLNKSRFHTELYERYDRLVEVRNSYYEAIELVSGVENIIIIDGDMDEIRLADAIWEKINVYFS